MNRHWRRIWLIGLLIALLPLRGWAWATMPVDVAANEIAVAAEAIASLPPCHASAPPVAAVDDAPGERPSPAHATCSLCDLCHAGVISAPDWAWPHHQPPATAPSWAVSPASGREGGDGLFRPPKG